MPQLLAKTTEGVRYELAPEEHHLLAFREEYSSWRNILTWLSENAPFRLREVWPIMQSIRAFERPHCIRLEVPMREP